MNGCEMMRCTDYHDGMCGIDGLCKYRVDDSVDSLTAECERYKANLEWLVYWCLRSDDPPISIGRGKELLGFQYMDDMRAWMNAMHEKEGE